MVFVSEVNKTTMQQRTDEMARKQKCGMDLCGLLVTAKKTERRRKITDLLSSVGMISSVGD